MEHITEPIGAHFQPPFSGAQHRLSLRKRGPKARRTAADPGRCRLYHHHDGPVQIRPAIFEGDSKILSQKSKEEMAKRQGATFSWKKTSAALPLAWAGIRTATPTPIMTCGEGVLQKSGDGSGSPPSSSVFPKYDAVLAISETHDCGLGCARSGPAPAGHGSVRPRRRLAQPLPAGAPGTGSATGWHILGALGHPARPLLRLFPGYLHGRRAGRRTTAV